MVRHLVIQNNVGNVNRQHSFEIDSDSLFPVDLASCLMGTFVWDMYMSG